MTITQLQYIVEVFRCGHFAQAAENCYVTQPTLSMQIQKLEDELGVILFDRSKKPVVATAIGKKVVDQAQDVLREHRRIYQVIEHEKEEVSGEFRIGIIPTISPYLLPLWLKSFQTNYPKVHLEIEELQTQHLLESLTNDHLDVGILATPLNHQGLVEKPLYYESFVGYFSKGHELLKQKTLKQERLAQENPWLLREGHCFRNQALEVCGSLKKEMDGPLFESGNLETLKRLVDHQEGFTLLPFLATQDFSEEEKKRVRCFSSPFPTREISLVRHRSLLKQRLVSCLEDEILAHLPEELRNESIDRAKSEVQVLIP